MTMEVGVQTGCQRMGSLKETCKWRHGFVAGNSITQVGRLWSCMGGGAVIHGRGDVQCSCKWFVYGENERRDVGKMLSRQGDWVRQARGVVRTWAKCRGLGPGFKQK